MELHNGNLVSGEVTCSCGWKSGHFAYAGDADEAFGDHLVEVGVITDTTTIDSIAEILYPTGNEDKEWSSNEIAEIANLICTIRPTKRRAFLALVDAG